MPARPTPRRGKGTSEQPEISAGAERQIEIPVSPGELVDRISILEIKATCIEDPTKLRNVVHALALLREVRARALSECDESECDELSHLESELKEVNESLWEIEDAIRACEADKDFGPRFIELARSVYRTNDRRAATKKRIDELFGSALTDEKSYRDY